MKRSKFPGIFWSANSIEVLERFAYYGIYMGFGIYMYKLGYSASQLGIVQGIFLLLSYTVPVISGSFADRFGFKKMLIVAYLAYLPSIMLLIFTKSFSGIALTMLSIGFAAGIFKPLISGTVRVVTDKTNKTLGFGIFYQMVNIGGSVGPLILGKLRVISWNYAFIAAAIAVGVMFIITLLFYKEPPREIEGVTLKQKMRDLGIALSDLKFLFFLVIIGLIFWIPMFTFINVLPTYIDKSLDTFALYQDIKRVFGKGIANFISEADDAGYRRILGETISNTGWFIIFLQVFISRIFERFRPIPSFLSGLILASAGFIFLGISAVGHPAMVFMGIFLFALGEMISSPRIQEYITWLAPKEKAGLYMGSNFLAIGLGGALSGFIYTPLSGHFRLHQHPEYIWYLLAVHILVGMIIMLLYNKIVGELKERDV
jgi:proton-dependent oligopeptide transporter, POT family